VNAVTRAKVVIIFVTADFLASTFLQEVELPEVLIASSEGGTIVEPWQGQAVHHGIRREGDAGRLA
jgi:hypothetical protein